MGGLSGSISCSSGLCSDPSFCLIHNKSRQNALTCLPVSLVEPAGKDKGWEREQVWPDTLCPWSSSLTFFLPLPWWSCLTWQLPTSLPSDVSKLSFEAVKIVPWITAAMRHECRQTEREVWLPVLCNKRPSQVKEVDMLFSKVKLMGENLQLKAEIVLWITVLRVVIISHSTGPPVSKNLDFGA